MRPISRSDSLPQANDSLPKQTAGPSSLGLIRKLAETALIRPVTKSVELACRVIKLITWDVGKAGVYKALGFHGESSLFLENKYLNTVRTVRDLLFLPSVAHSLFKEIVSKKETAVDDLKSTAPQSYLSKGHTKGFEQFSSYLHGFRTFQVIRPTGINEFASESDGDLKTVMASHFLKPDVLAINFGIPNVASFVTEANEDGAVQTVKVDAKSFKREPMTYHATNGKIQSGIFFVPTNLPPEALEKYKAAANELQGRADITCVNTNCRVLKLAGFSIEGKEMEDVVFPTTLMEHLLFRNVFYTDSAGQKHKVHFDIVNTTEQTIEEHYEKIDIAVLGTRLRHRRRHADTEEDRKTRGIAAKALIAEEKKRLAQEGTPEWEESSNSTKRKVTVSVPSFLGDQIGRIWGRHTLYEVDFSDTKDEIGKAFANHNKLVPFPQEKPSLLTRIKRDFFFSNPMIRFLRRHMMGRSDTLYLNTTDLLSHLKTTGGGRLNYVILDDKVVLARINANGSSEEGHRKAADWALSKHALLAGRKEVNCTGELWYDKDKQSFVLNGDSGTYLPNEDRVKIAVDLANRIFKTSAFEAAIKAGE